jgi:hypothetical protein
MIPISEVLEEAAREADKWATPEQVKFGNGGPGAAIRALAAKYEGCMEHVGWIDEFGNVFPLAAWNGKPHHLFDYKQKWTPLYCAKEPTK